MVTKTNPAQSPVASAKTSTPKAVAPKKPAARKPAVKKPVAAKTAAIQAAANSATVKKNIKPIASQAKTPAAKKPTAKAAKPQKIKMERDSFTMPKEEYAQLAILKTRLNALGQPAKKSELLRAGIKLLAAMSDNTLKTTLAKIPVIKTGRPKKK